MEKSKDKRKESKNYFCVIQKKMNENEKKRKNSMKSNLCYSFFSLNFFLVKGKDVFIY